MSDSLQDYAYDFPEELIALHPSAERGASRLMVLDRATGNVVHGNFRDIVSRFAPGDVLVLNNSKVFPCRLVTRRRTGGRQEILLLRPAAGGADAKTWRVLVNASHKVRSGDVFEFAGLSVTVLDDEGNERLARLEHDGELPAVLEKIADMPLPPYIRRANEPSDRERYQTVFARETGSVAAPTAGLHFTPALLSALRDKGLSIVEVTLHVGPGTFLPVRDGDINRHRMHSEFFSIGEMTCATLNRAKAEGRKIAAVGTTSARVLETLARKGFPFAPQCGETDIFIRPPHAFKAVDRLLTNFHQPESTLLMLVSAFAGREFVLNAYREAIEKKYRIFSYGDAMLIL